MSANPKFVAATAQVDEAAIRPLPKSRKVYVEGSRTDLRVPMREISQSETSASFGSGSESVDCRCTTPRGRIPIPIGEDRYPLGSRTAAHALDRRA